MTNSGDTICAIATPVGVSAIGVVKVSGALALDVVSKIFRVSKGFPPLSEVEGYRAVYGFISDPVGGELIDDAMALVYRAPHSYTGEDVVELSCHGAPLILREVIRLLCTCGARVAEPGEYTRRALANGKMDLSQAEAVADVIASTSRAALRMSMTQMRGGYGERIRALRDPLIQLASLLELELDFSEEEVEFADREELMQRCEEVKAEIRSLADSYETGSVIKAGIPVAIVGATNAGKSTLLNALLQEDRAIVSDIHGTTRDTIEEVMLIGGKEYRLIDTAGIRDTEDRIETIGIGRALERVAQASLILWVVDGVDPEPETLSGILSVILQHTQRDKLLVLVNKQDLLSPVDLERVMSTLRSLGVMEIHAISARDRKDVEHVKGLIARRFEDLQVHEGEVIVSNLRHAEALKRAWESLTRVSEGLQSGLPGDLVAQDLREAIHSLSEVVGDITTDDLLHNIFAHFCIGK